MDIFCYFILQNETNTIQTVLISNGSLTFCQFNYGELEWYKGSGGPHEFSDAQVLYLHMLSAMYIFTIIII